MDPKKIMQADVLDIIFEHRNKAYGAYDLRRSYNRRLVKALVSTAAIVLFLLMGYFLSGMTTREKPRLARIDEVDLSEAKVQKKEEPIVIPPPKADIKLETKQFTPPRIVHDDEVNPDEKPPEQDKLDDTKIGTVNQEGAKDDGLTAPPVSDAGKGVVEAPKKEEDDYEKTFAKVEIESSYPGGDGAWSRYLHKNLRYPDEAQNIEIEGTVVVQFIVDKEGNVSDVVALSGPETGGLREEAVRVIRKSGKWMPAIQNGHQVRSYKKQPVGFKMTQE